MVKSATSNSQVKLILALFVASLLLYAVYVCYNKYSLEKFADDALPKVVLYTANWCSHCTSFKASGNWEAAEKKAKEAGLKVAFVKYDYDENKDLAEKYSVNSFPTIISIDANRKKTGEFTGDRNNVEALVSFAKKAAGAQ